MNRRILLTLLLLVLGISVTANIGFMFLGAEVTHTYLAAEGERSTDAFLETVSQLYRKDLLVGNFRATRLSLQGLLDRGVIAGYQIRSTDSLDQSDGYEKLIASNTTTSFSSEISFGPDGPPWGRITYLVPKHSLLTSAQRQSSIYTKYSLLALLFTLLPIAAIFALAIRTTGSLPQVLKVIAETGRLPTAMTSLESRLWLPTLTNFSVLAGEARDARQAEIMNTIASQVAHDIRSPLASLQAIVGQTTGLDERTRSDIRTVCRRIADIANNLLQKHRGLPAALPVPQEGVGMRGTAAFVPSNEPMSSELLMDIIEGVVSEKRLQHSAGERPVAISAELQKLDVFSEVQPTELARVLSNLINNSIEAFDTPQSIADSQRPAISLQLMEVPSATGNGRVRLTISDNGKGIPPELLEAVVKRGGTFGKPDGNGLGLWHAKATIEHWSGTLSVSSTVAKGTVVTLELPMATPPSWFASAISLTSRMTVVVLDDDPTVHSLWEKRIAELRVMHANIPPLVHAYSGNELLAWYRGSVGTWEEIHFLCDYELPGSPHTGLDLIDMLGIRSMSTLVTGRNSEPEIRARAAAKGVRILPKLLAPSIPITVALPIAAGAESGDS